MHALTRVARCLTIIVVLLLGTVAWAGAADATPAPNHVIATAAAIKRTEVKARAAERRVHQLRVVARRACAAHHRKLCRATRRRLKRTNARLQHLHKLLSELTGATGSSGAPVAGSPKAAPVAPPVVQPSFGFPGFQPGLDAGTNMVTDVAGASTLGAKLVRVEFSISTPAAALAPVIAGYAAKGIRVLPLAGFYASMATPAQAQNIAGWASAYGPNGSFWAGRADGQLAIRSIEFGNETSYGYQYGDGAGAGSYTARAQTYAVRVKEAAEAIATTGTGVGVLAQADDWTGDWVNGMFSAVPNLGSYVAGWTIHPYGTGWQVRLADLVSQTASHGASSSIPVDVTEWGVADDNGRCLNDNYGMNRCMSYAEAASVLASSATQMHAMLGSRLGTFILYQVRDQAASGSSTQREAYFGALQQNLQPKGAYTAQVQALLASS